MMKRVDCLFVLLLCPLSINPAKAVPIQRANSCVVTEVGQVERAIRPPVDLAAKELAGSFQRVPLAMTVILSQYVLLEANIR